MQATINERPSTFLGIRIKFIIGIVLIAAAVIYLIISSTQANAQYFMTVEELQSRGKEVVGMDIRVSGAVLGDSIQYDTEKLKLVFAVAHIPGDNAEIEKMGGIANVLHEATLDPSLARLTVAYDGVKPDLLKNEAQAIMTGRLDDKGVFHAEELLLKCPTKYEDAVPGQVEK